MSNVFSQEALPIRNQITEWVEIKKNIGDSVSGVFIGWFENPSKNEGFKDQLVAVLKRDTDGAVVAVALNDNQINRDRLSECLSGDEIGIRYDADKDVGKPQKAKIINIYNPELEQRAKAGKKVVTKAVEAGDEPDLGGDIDDFLPEDPAFDISDETV